ncbi:MAG: hypothetical protein ABI379_00250 [Rhodanobacter sp.]
MSIVPNAVLSIPSVVELIKFSVVVVAILASGFSLVGAIALWRAGEEGARDFFGMFERLQMLQLLTVMFVIGSVTVLGLLGVLDSNGVTGILSGVAGYVLGGLNRAPAPPAAKTPSAPADPQ